MKKIIFTFISVGIFFSSCTNHPSLSIKLIPAKFGEKWGYINREGKIIINPQFNEAHIFFNGFALVKSNEGKYGYIGEDGKYKIDPVYVHAQRYFSNEGIACVVPNGDKPQFINREGKVKFRIESANYVGEMCNGLSVVKINNKWGFINSDGKLIINPIYDDVEFLSEGVIAVALKDAKGELKWGFINNKGEVVINFQFTTNSNEDFLFFREDLAAVSNDGKKWGYINKGGKYEINPQFDKAYNFENGIAVIKQGDNWGFIDKSGKFIINPQFMDGGLFSENNLAPVKSSDNKWGFINKEGKYVINPQFDEVTNFIDGIAVVKLSSKYGIINEKGNYISNPQFDEISIEDAFNFPNTVESDFIDAKAIVDSITENSNDTMFRSINAVTTLKEIIKENPQFKDENLALHTVTFDTIENSDIKFNQDIAYAKVEYWFRNNTYTNKTIYRNVPKYNYFTGSYFNENDFDHYEKEYNYEAKVLGANYQFGFIKLGEGRSKIIAEELKNVFVEKLKLSFQNCPEIENSDNYGSYIFRSKNIFASVGYLAVHDEGSIIPTIVIEIIFIKNDNEDFTKLKEDWVKNWKEICVKNPQKQN